jgi:hypothetical protein
MNNKALPQIAGQYGCGLVDIRGQWLDYLRANHLAPKALLSDDVHLNAHGNFLMAQLIARYLVYRPELEGTADKGTVTTLTVGKEVRWKNGRLSVPFEGNRVDLIAGPGVMSKERATILVDGRKPSSFPGAYAFTRPEPHPWSPLFLSRVDRNDSVTPVVEAWTLTVTEAAEQGKPFSYGVEGSRTGADGTGKSDAPFASVSGRVRIAPEAFFRPGDKALPAGYQVTWRVIPLHADTWTAPAVAPGAESATTVVQGIENSGHTLEVMAPKGKLTLPALRAIRVYRPPVAAAVPSLAGKK